MSSAESIREDGATVIANTARDAVAEARDAIAQLRLEAVFASRAGQYDRLDGLADRFEALLLNARGANWEYGFTSKWGIQSRASRAEAERSAAALRDEVEKRKSSGDLRFHGVLMRRTVAEVGAWEEVPTTENSE